ncbi:MAG: nickel insertion protein [Isosphaeraceae bacterium]
MIKLGWVGERPPTFSPEYDDCARIAAERGIPLREVFDAVQAAYARSGAVDAQPKDEHHHH